MPVARVPANAAAAAAARTVVPAAIADFYVRGRLDVSTAADLRAELIQVLEDQAERRSTGERDVADGLPDDLVVDLSRVEVVDMVGVGLLVGVHRQAGRCGRRLVLTGVPPRVMRLLTATRLRRVLSVRDVPRPAPIRLTHDERDADAACAI